MLNLQITINKLKLYFKYYFLLMVIEKGENRLSDLNTFYLSIRYFIEKKIYIFRCNEETQKILASALGTNSRIKSWV